jgi:lysozyme
MPLTHTKPLFDAIRLIHGKLTQADVDLINKALVLCDGNGASELTVPTDGRYDVSPQGVAAMKGEEGCKLTAYPDPGSKDGKPWTVGFGSTGPDIVKGTVWTQAQADARFLADLRRFEGSVEAKLGTAPTSQQQFDALVSFAYNVGIGALSTSTLLAKHLAGDFAGAAEQFARWINNDGKPMPGLKARRAREAAIYSKGIYA